MRTSSPEVGNFVKLRGARVLAVASGHDGVELARRLGADETIDGKSDDIGTRRAASRRTEWMRCSHSWAGRSSPDVSTP